MNRNVCTQPTLRDIGQLSNTTNVLNHEKTYEDTWMASVHDYLYDVDDNEVQSPLMRSSFHATRMNIEGTAPLKCLEALLPLFYQKSATPEMILHGMQLVKRTTEF